MTDYIIYFVLLIVAGVIVYTLTRSSEKSNDSDGDNDEVDLFSFDDRDGD